MQHKIQLVPGFSFFGKNIGIKDDTLDFGGILSDHPCQAATVFTKNTMPGAPVMIGREHVRDGILQAIIVNSKNANVATESQGIQDSKKICRLVAESCGIELTNVLPSSTGVIGRYLPMQVIADGCAHLKADFGKTSQHAEDFARSIMTTDSNPKWVSANIGAATIFAVAKGAGMIEPNMATMLSYFVTDAQLSSAQLQTILKSVVDKSFNRLSIDTDTSTSDTVVVLANGLAGEVDLAEFERVFQKMAIYLAKEIARDAEGASKLIELTVSGANTQEQALLTAKSIINSPLVKTAIYGADPNWGRFVMAIGKVFQYHVSIRDLKIFFGQGNNRFIIDAEVIDRNAVKLDEIADLLKKEEVFIEVVLGTGAFSETVWGCDLTEGYIKVNAYYTT